MEEGREREDPGNLPIILLESSLHPVASLRTIF